MKTKLIGKFVIVRCHDAGVHAGTLLDFEGRTALISNSRRLWYWIPNEGKFLSAVAKYGLHEDSKIGTKLPLLYLSETCEIILCSNLAKRLISGFPDA